MSNVSRRNFLKKASLATLAAGSAALLPSCNAGENTSEAKAPAIHSRKTYQWKMVTTWQPRFPVVGEGAEKFAKWVEEMSEGRLKIRVYGSGELVPALEVFEAVQQGMAEMGHGASYYWAGKMPAAQFFAAIPFGMNAQQMNTWLHNDQGQELWQRLYEPFNLIPFPCGNTGVQMGGWFNRKINTIQDFKGLKMRIPGLGGKVIKKAGGSAILSAGGEIFTNLERGVIDATEWIGPYHDVLMGFHKIAKYYYYPGWHEPGSTLELLVNKNAYQSLPGDIQQIIQAAAYRSNAWMLSEFEVKNSIYFQKLKDENKVQILKFPDAVLAKLKQYADEVIEELIANDPDSKKIYQSIQAFRQRMNHWANVTEAAYYDSISSL